MTNKGMKYKMKITMEERFWARVEKKTGCWDWIGRLAYNGYGQFHADGGTKYPHRVSWEIHNGRKIPEGMDIDHICRNRRCVNPDHLEVVSHRENILRGTGQTARNHRKQYCKYGHEFTEENTLVNIGIEGRPGRHCKKCLVKNGQAYNLKRRKQALAAFGVEVK